MSWSNCACGEVCVLQQIYQRKAQNCTRIPSHVYTIDIIFDISAIFSNKLSN